MAAIIRTALSEIAVPALDMIQIYRIDKSRWSLSENIEIRSGLGIQLILSKVRLSWEPQRALLCAIDVMRSLDRHC